MKKFLYTTAAIAISTLSAYAQSPQELLMFSRHNFGISSARSSAMGGAFTSLGADAISMSLNPAGLAMYSAPEISISPGLRMSYSSATANQGLVTSSENYTKPTVANFSAVFTNGDGLVWGVAMNRLADLSDGYSAEGNYSTGSMAYMFRDQMQGSSQGSFDGSGAFNRPPSMWGAVLANNTWLVNPTRDVPENKSYDLDGVLEQGDEVASLINSTSNGAVDEFAISGAYNHNNLIYFGVSVGLQNLNYRQNTSYNEFADLDYNYGGLDSFNLSEDLTLNGFGVNLKVGLTVRPVSWFRVAVAYHSPTWITMNEGSFRQMNTWLTNTDPGHKFNYSPDLLQSYDYQTPSRLMAGASFTIAKRVIVSVDYERTWYNNMLYTTDINAVGWRAPITPTDIDNNPNIVENYLDARGNINMNDMIHNSYRATNNYRIGVEAQPVNGFFLRAGYGYSESPYAPVESVYQEGVSLSNYGAINQYSGGLGYRARRFGIDLSYVYSEQDLAPAVFYDYVTTTPYRDMPDGTRLLPPDNIYKSLFDHNIILTFAWRF